MGRKRYGSPKRLLITADNGDSNSPRTRLWLSELQRFANDKRQLGTYGANVLRRERRWMQVGDKKQEHHLTQRVGRLKSLGWIKLISS